MGVHARQYLQHRGSIPEGFSHADDSTAAERHARLTHPLKRL